MADGPTLRPKSTGQQQLPCPEMEMENDNDNDGDDAVVTEQHV